MKSEKIYRITRCTLFWGAIMLSLATTAMCIWEREFCASGKVLGSGWVYGFSYSVSIISLLLSSWAHREQLRNQVTIKEDIQELLTRQPEKKEENADIAPIDYLPSAITEIAMYSMFMVYTHRPFKVDKILPDNIELISVVIDTISSSYKTDFLEVHIDRNNLLVVRKFDTTHLPPIEMINDDFGSKYNSAQRKMMKDAKKRINVELNS